MTDKSQAVWPIAVFAVIFAGMLTYSLASGKPLATRVPPQVTDVSSEPLFADGPSPDLVLHGWYDQTNWIVDAFDSCGSSTATNADLYTAVREACQGLPD